MKKQNETPNIGVVYPIPLYKGKIISVLRKDSEKHGVWYSVSIVHDDGNGHALNLIHNEYENWLGRIIDAQNQLSENFYEMVMNNWEKIMKHLNDCIAWINACETEPKHKKGDSIKIVNYDGLDGKSDIVKDYCISPFVGYYYVLEKFSIHQGQFIHFKEMNLVPV